MNASDLKKLQTLAVSSLSRGRHIMHNALMASLVHIAEHGDRNALHYLMNALKVSKADSGNRVRIVKWLEDFGGMQFDNDKDSPTKGDIIGWEGKAFITEKLALAKATPWYEYKKPAHVKAIKPDADKAEPDTVQEAFNIDAELRKLLARVTETKAAMATMSQEQLAATIIIPSENVLDEFMAAVGYDLAIQALEDVAA